MKKEVDRVRYDASYIRPACRKSHSMGHPGITRIHSTSHGEGNIMNAMRAGTGPPSPP